MKSIKFPENIEGNTGSERLIAFFKAVGWDGEQRVEPTKIKVCERRWQEMCEWFNLPEEALMVYVNYGPSSDDCVPYNEVHVYDGAFHESEDCIKEA
jgi:hypothetical protein